MTFIQSLLRLLLIIPVLSSCDTQDEKIPSYLYVEKFTFLVKPGQGSANQNLTDAWISVSGNFYGAYELPVWIPVLEEGLSEVRIIPGYRQDGKITNPFRYALLNPYETTVTLLPRETDTIKPITSYQDGLEFSLIEDFDNRHFFNGDRDGDVETKIVLSDSLEALEGPNAGLIELTSGHPKIAAEYIINQNIPKSGDPIILELNYKSDIPFSIGFIGYNATGVEENLINANLFPKSEWTKVYFDFRDIINQSNADYYHLVIVASYRSDNSKPIQRILLDNIKVIHR